ncbi:MAG: helix-hairpin-helix domain-containing protein, partial [Candidatus Eisenbacteria bacterium]
MAVALSVLPARCVADDVASGVDDISPDDSIMREVLAGLEDEGAALDGLDELLREAAAFRENPVDVNAAGLSDLLRVPFLDPAAAVRIVARRDVLGPVASLDELVVRGCINREALPAVRPYLVVRHVVHPPVPETAAPEVEDTMAPVPQTAPSQVAWELRLRATAQERWDAAWGARGVVNGTGTFARLRVSYGDRLDLSVACEKDAGESGLADHSVVSLVWRDVTDAAEDGPAFVVGVGDFVGSWGQGLLLRSGGFPSEAAYPRRRDSVRRYDGAGEGSARRGVFVTASRGKACVRAILARSALDAAVGEDGLATSIRTTGYHRTEGEREGASYLDESLAGARVTFEQPAGLELSASVLRLGYSPGLMPGDPVRQRFGFRGEDLTAGGLDVRTSRGELMAGCEVAATSARGVAALAAARLGRGSSRVNAGAGYLSRDYWAPLGGGVPGFSGGSNGAVGWVGAEYRSGADWKIWAATRIARRPWRSYYSELPNGSSSVTVGGEFRSKRDWRIAVESRVRSRTDSEGDPPATADGIVRRTSVSLRTMGSVPVVVSAWRVTSLSDGLEEGSFLAVALRVSGSITGTSS